MLEARGDRKHRKQLFNLVLTCQKKHEPYEL